MLSLPFQAGFLAAVLLATESLAGPVAFRPSDLEVFPVLQGRSSVITLGDYSLVTSHEDYTLLDLFDTTSGSNAGETANLKVECIDCRTWGNAVVTNAGVTKKSSVIGNIISFFKNPVETIINAFDMDIKVDFTGVGGHFEFGIIASDTVTYSVPIFTSETPAGIAISEDVSVGLILIIDLVFSLSAEVELDAGFEFSFPDGAYITVDPLGGDIVDHDFSGGITNNLPVTITSGSATFKAALRIRAQAGTTVEVFGTGFDFELGISADLIEYVATMSSTDTCKLSITEGIDVNIGAYAHAVAEIDYSSFGAVPATVTTILTIPLPSLCITRTSAASTVLATTVGITATALPASTSASTIAQTSVSQTAASATSTESASRITVLSIAPTESAGSSSASGIFFQSTSSDTWAPWNATSTAAAASSTEAVTTLQSTVHLTSSTVLSLLTDSSYTTNSPSWANATITTSAAALTTATVYSTTLITVTSCASTVLHCPATAQSELVITSTTILYTTVCPVAEALSSAFPTTIASVGQLTIPAATTSVPAQTNTVISSALTLTPPSTPVVSIVYTPTFVNPTYTMPTATSFSVPFPNWNCTQATSFAAAATTQVATAKVLSTPLPPVSVETIRTAEGVKTTEITSTAVLSVQTKVIGGIQTATSAPSAAVCTGCLKVNGTRTATDRKSVV